MENKNEPQLSPYMQLPPQNLSKDDEHFLVELDRLCQSYGYDKYFIAFSSKNHLPANEVQWKAFSNGIGEQLVKYLEIMVQGIRKAWEDLKKKRTL